ncbi:MAG TPA: hypothetical protein VMU94_10720 [Streptosporangiaceae bacterium]|nr:hypothetical protein [Streptosporangiaceae bacterium]
MSSVGGLVSSIKAATWDQTWQAASVRERWALAGTIFAGFGVGWVAAVGLRAVLPVANWLFYYALWGSLYAWLGRSRSVADAPGRDPGVRVLVGQAEKAGLDILRLPNWVRDVFRTLPAAGQANVSRLGRWLDGPFGVIGATVLLLALLVTSQQERSDPVGVRVLLTFPAAFGSVASQRVYLHRKSRRGAFAERVGREISTQLTGSGAPAQAFPAPGPALAASSDAANSLRTQIVVGVAISLAIGLFFYLLPPQYH